MSRRARIVLRTRGALATFLETEASGGIVLIAAAAAGMLWANALPGYETFWHTKLAVGGVDNDLQHWVNDGLMTIFFLVVGLEIKRELVTGELHRHRLRRWRARPARLSGPVRTEALPAHLGHRRRHCAIVVIALVYSRGIEWGWLTASGLAFVVVVLMRLVWIRQPVAYLLVGAVAWAAILSSGIHPTIAGVVLGLLVPARPVRGRAVLEDLERWLHPVSSYVVVPIFALANAGIVLTADSMGASISSGVFWGVALGLLLGKTVGIAGASFIAERSRVGKRPAGVSMRDVGGGAMLAGIGFTVSLFIAGLAFDSAVLVDQARLGILVGSIASALAGAVTLGFQRRATRGVCDDVIPGGER